MVLTLKGLDLRSGSYFEGAGFDISDSDVIRSYSWKNVEAENAEESALNEEDLIMMESSKTRTWPADGHHSNYSSRSYYPCIRVIILFTWEIIS